MAGLLLHCEKVQESFEGRNLIVCPLPQQKQCVQLAQTVTALVFIFLPSIGTWKYTKYKKLMHTCPQNVRVFLSNTVVNKGQYSNNMMVPAPESTKRDQWHFTAYRCLIRQCSSVPTKEKGLQVALKNRDAWTCPNLLWQIVPQGRSSIWKSPVTQEEFSVVFLQNGYIQ